MTIKDLKKELIALEYQKEQQNIEKNIKQLKKKIKMQEERAKKKKILKKPIFTVGNMANPNDMIYKY